MKPHRLLEETDAGTQSLACSYVLQMVPGLFPRQRIDAVVGVGLAAWQSLLTGAWTTSGQLLLKSERGRCFVSLAWARPRWQPGLWLMYLPEEGMESRVMWEARHLFSLARPGCWVAASLMLHAWVPVLWDPLFLSTWLWGSQPAGQPRLLSLSLLRIRSKQ